MIRAAEALYKPIGPGSGPDPLGEALNSGNGKLLDSRIVGESP